MSFGKDLKISKGKSLVTFGGCAKSRNAFLLTKHGIVPYTLLGLHGLNHVWLTLPLPNLAALQSGMPFQA